MKADTQSFYERAVRRAVARVLASLDEALDLERLAREAALSPFHFHRIFRGMVGETPLELHRRLRMERAAAALVASDESVTAIALGAGYDTHEAFTRAFRARYACAPSELRQMRVPPGSACRRVQTVLAAPSGIHHWSSPSQAETFVIAMGDLAMQVDIEKCEDLRCAAVEYVGPYHRISSAFAKLGDLAEPGGLLKKPCRMIAVYHDDPETTPEAEQRADAALAVGEEVAIPKGLVEVRVPGGKYATTIHRGSYEKLGDTWARFMGQWLPQSGHRLGDGVTYEEYVNNPTQVPTEQLVTKLFLPIA